MTSDTSTKKAARVWSSRGFLVTISQLPITKTPEELNKALDSVRAKEQELGYKITALAGSLEEHKDKGIHLHFAIAFDKRRTLKSQYWNFLFDKQANIQPITWNQRGSKSRAFSYVIKTGDVSFKDEGAQEFINDAPRKYTGTRLDDFITKIIEEGATLVSLQEHELIEVRTYVMKHRGRVTKAILSQRTVKYEIAQSKSPGVSVTIPPSLSADKKELLQWFQKIQEHKYHWPHRECCLMIIGKPQTGKSTLLRKLAEFVRSYSFPVANWFTGYQNNFYDIILWEEPNFKPHSCSFLKLLLEGHELDLPMKGSMTTKGDRPLMCLCSNHSLKNLFMRAYLLAEERKHCNSSETELCDCTDNTSCPLGEHHLDFQALYTRVKQINIKENLFDLLPLLQGLK